jgi:hypothetical protein
MKKPSLSKLYQTPLFLRFTRDCCRKMSFAAVVFLFIHLARSDPCKELCRKDGPTVCTGGSWTKPDGVCHGYLYRDSDGNIEHCYHNSATAVDCPQDGRPVRASDAASLLRDETNATLPEFVVEVLDDGFTLQMGENQIAMIVPNSEECMNAILEWTPITFIESMMTTESALRFPFLSQQLASAYDVEGRFIDGYCKDDSDDGIRHWFRFSLPLEGERALPVFWPDVMCSMLAVFKQQLMLRIALKNW